MPAVNLHREVVFLHLSNRSGDLFLSLGVAFLLIFSMPSLAFGFGAGMGKQSGSRNVIPAESKRGASLERSTAAEKKKQPGILIDSIKKVVKSNDQWRKQLTGAEFDVTRQKGTEQAFSGKYWDSKKDGVYVCKCCGHPLFDSKTKFKSGTGWPSYTSPIASKSVSHIGDFSLQMVRTEVVCLRCDSHLGHVFDDGPKPTGLRYCMNSVSLKLVGRKEWDARQAKLREKLDRALEAEMETKNKKAGASGKRPKQRLKLN